MNCTVHSFISPMAMNYRLRCATLGIVSISVLVLLGGCSRSESNDVIDQVVAEAAIAAQPSSQNDAPETPVIKDAIYATTASKDSSVVLRTNEVPAVPTPKDFSSKTDELYIAQPLNHAEVALIESELGPNEEIFADHSFALTLSDWGDVVFVASKVYREGDPDRLALRFRDLNGDYVPLVPNPDIPDWILWDVDAVAFEDVNADGAGPDIIVIAEYMTGIGRNGTYPFPVATVFFNDGDDYFATDSYVDELLSSQGVETVDEVRTLLREAF